MSARGGRPRPALPVTVATPCSAGYVNLHEPATFLTDCLLGGLALFLAWRLRAPTPAVRWWRHTFVLTSASAIVGGTYHGFGPNFPPAFQSAWWLITLWIISGVSACIAMSLLHELAPAQRQPFWRRVIGFKFALALAIAVVRPDFGVAIVDYGLALASWLVAAVAVRRAWSGWILAGLGLSAVAAIVQQSGWPRLPAFNHNDLYHLIQALGLIAFFQGARRLGMSDKQGSP